MDEFCQLPAMTVEAIGHGAVNDRPGPMPNILRAVMGRRGAGSFDRVIFDTPPMAAGSDPFVLGAHTGNVLMVLRSGSTNKELAAAKLDSFLRLPVRIFLMIRLAIRSVIS